MIVIEIRIQLSSFAHSNVNMCNVHAVDALSIPFFSDHRFFLELGSYSDPKSRSHLHLALPTFFRAQIVSKAAQGRSVNHRIEQQPHPRMVKPADRDIIRQADHRAASHAMLRHERTAGQLLQILL